MQQADRRGCMPVLWLIGTATNSTSPSCAPISGPAVRRGSGCRRRPRSAWADPCCRPTQALPRRRNSFGSVSPTFRIRLRIRLGRWNRASRIVAAHHQRPRLELEQPFEFGVGQPGRQGCGTAPSFQAASGAWIHFDPIRQHDRHVVTLPHPSSAYARASRLLDVSSSPRVRVCPLHLTAGCWATVRPVGTACRSAGWVRSSVGARFSRISGGVDEHGSSCSSVTPASLASG